MHAKVALITGASRGIGRNLALALAKRGVAVGLLARNQKDLDALKLEVEQFGVRACVVACDVAKRAQVHAAIETCVAELGPIDLLIANAGISKPLPAKRFDASVFTQVWDVNVRGAVYAIEPVLKSMLQRGAGHIVGISSLASYVAIPGHGAYCSSKVALSTLLAAMRTEVEKKGIAVSTICPGYIRTDMTATNEFKMPFLMDLDRATDIIMRGIEKRQRVVNFPWQLYLVVRLAALLPEWLRQRLLPKRRSNTP